jgi:proteasome lid subunit RPN8/RPN11
VKQVVLPQRLRAAAAEEGRKGYPFEVCGALVGKVEGASAVVTRIVSYPNVADESQRRRRFAIEPVALVRLDRELRKSGEALIGFYHSHPDHPAAPSSTDMEYFRLWPGTVWIIIPIEKGAPGTARAWWLENSETENAAEIELSTGC